MCESICGLDVISPMRYAIDVVQATEAAMGLHRFSIYLINITNTGGIRPGVGGTQVVARKRLTIGPTGFFTAADGYDGYLNPSFSQVSAKDIFLSNNLLTSKDFKLGPIVYPYDTGLSSGGTNINLTNPVVIPSNNLQLYFQVFAEGLPQTGWIMKRKWSREDSNLCYYIYLENTGKVIDSTFTPVYDSNGKILLDDFGEIVFV